jgi:ABC transporter DrrB family efflux protein
MTTAIAPTTSSTVVRHRPGVGWVAVDSFAITGRNLRRLTRAPDAVFWALVQPIMFVLLFAYVFGGAIPLPGGGSYREYLMVGIFAQTVAFGSIGTAIGLADDLSRGLMDRFRSSPMARPAVLAGRTTADLVTALVTLVVMAIVAYFVGWRIRDGVPRAVAAFGILLLFAFAVSWIGAYLGLTVGKPEAAGSAVMTILFPLVFVSSAFVPIEGMPDWLQSIALWNPVSAAVSAARDLFGNPNPYPAGAGFPAEHPVLFSVIWSVALVVVVAPLAVMAFRRLKPR